MGTRGRVSAENEEGVGVGHVQGEVRAGAAEAPPQVNCGVSLLIFLDWPLSTSGLTLNLWSTFL